MGRYARRVDKTQAAIVAALRKNGCYVLELFRLPEAPDLAVAIPARNGRPARWILAEVKSPGGEFTEWQRELMLRCPAPVHVWVTPEDALRDTE